MVSTRQSSNVGSGEGSNVEPSSHSLPGTKLRTPAANTIYEGLASFSSNLSSLPTVSSSGSTHGSSTSGNGCFSGSSSSISSICSIASSSGISSASSSITEPLNLLDLPPEVLEKIFSYLGYHSVAQLRLVCKQMDSVCCNVLNSTFQRLQNLMLNRFQAIRAKMPRRESARRHHPLALESDIIETLHMRLTLLQMTFGKHIERKHCCFFAGEILDEVFRILHYIKVTPKLARPYKVTDELFDLSTMAMEYFKEHIEPTLPEISCFSTEFLDFSGSFSRKDDNSMAPLSMAPTHQDVDSLLEPSFPQSNMVLRKRIRKIKQGMKRYNSQLGVMRRDLRNCKSKIGEQQKLLLEYATRLDENDKKSEETSRKFSTLLQELNKCKTELQFWRSKASANPPLCQNCGCAIPVVPGEDIQTMENQGVLEGLLPSPTPTDGEDPFRTLWAAEESSCASNTHNSRVGSSSIAFVGPGSPASSFGVESSGSGTSLLCNTNTNCNFPAIMTSAPSSGTGSLDPPVANVSAKRKLSTDDQVVGFCKSRRTTHIKSRTSKRASKI